MLGFLGNKLAKKFSDAISNPYRVGFYGVGAIFLSAMFPPAVPIVAGVALGLFVGSIVHKAVDTAINLADEYKEYKQEKAQNRKNKIQKKNKKKLVKAHNKEIKQKIKQENKNRPNTSIKTENPQKENQQTKQLQQEVKDLHNLLEKAGLKHKNIQEPNKKNQNSFEQHLENKIDDLINNLKDFNKLIASTQEKEAHINNFGRIIEKDISEVAKTIKESKIPEAKKNSLKAKLKIVKTNFNETWNKYKFKKMTKVNPVLKRINGSKELNNKTAKKQSVNRKRTRANSMR